MYLDRGTSRQSWTCDEPNNRNPRMSPAPDEDPTKILVMDARLRRYAEGPPGMSPSNGNGTGDGWKKKAHFTMM